jgi:hypothetical protein
MGMTQMVLLLEQNQQFNRNLNLSMGMPSSPVLKERPLMASKISLPGLPT